MTEDTWTLDASDGELLIRTGVAGRAARLGHRLTIAVDSWQVAVSRRGNEPVGITFAADVDSLQVRGGDGGLKSLSGPEKFVARTNALKSLGAKAWPRITFHASRIDPVKTGYQILGSLEIRGRERPCTVDLRIDDRGGSWRMSFTHVVRQSDFGIEPYSLALGAIRVADDVTVSFTADRRKEL